MEGWMDGGVEGRVDYRRNDDGNRVWVAGWRTRRMDEEQDR